ncbi:MAG: hypothetical protein ACK56I_01415, partial [bacterium]
MEGLRPPPLPLPPGTPPMGNVRVLSTSPMRSFSRPPPMALWSLSPPSQSFITMAGRRKYSVLGTSGPNTFRTDSLVS